MPSFNSSYEFHDFRRASHLDNGFLHDDSASFFLQSTDHDFNPFPLPTLSPNCLSLLSDKAEDDLHLTAFLPMSRPLLLPKSHSGGSSEFQSVGAFPFDLEDRHTEYVLRPKNGLGLHFGEGTGVPSTVEAGDPLSGLPSVTSSDCPPYAIPDSSPAYLTMLDPFDSSGNFYVVPGGLTQSDILADHKPLRTPILSFSTVLNSSLATVKGEENDLSCGLTFSNSSYSVASSLSLVEPLTSLPGLVADINMFEQIGGNSNFCVRPQDLIRGGEQLFKGPDFGTTFKAEETSSAATTRLTCDTVSTSIRDSQPLWPPVSSEHIPDVFERYFLQFPPICQPLDENSGNKQGALQSLGQANSPAGVGGIAQKCHSPAYLYTPITTEILDATGEPACSPSSVRKELSDKTNVPRSRNPANVLEMYDSLIPHDVALENPHEGISGKDVAQKTKYFMMMHPGGRLSDELLFSFAGRLSATGESIQGYRCYIADCMKTTKRKDHMGDHIRTHLGEKPFQCGVCGLGFIRNNDCQRHENNHRPEKKFVCDCHAAFSRRDLFVRHQKTACALITAGSGFSRRPRRYTKTTLSGRGATPDEDDLNDLDYNPTRGVSFGV
ncbi:hypothetical protein M0805_007481 [Coniferiporia weirii]|nr:hypothetical protein M0805_007481 [Coniferiporia weirii]